MRSKSKPKIPYKQVQTINITTDQIKIVDAEGKRDKTSLRNNFVQETTDASLLDTNKTF